MSEQATDPAYEEIIRFFPEAALRWSSLSLQFMEMWLQLRIARAVQGPQSDLVGGHERSAEQFQQMWRSMAQDPASFGSVPAEQRSRVMAETLTWAGSDPYAAEALHAVLPQLGQGSAELASDLRAAIEGHGLPVFELRKHWARDSSELQRMFENATPRDWAELVERIRTDPRGVGPVLQNIDIQAVMSDPHPVRALAAHFAAPGSTVLSRTAGEFQSESSSQQELNSSGAGANPEVHELSETESRAATRLREALAHHRTSANQSVPKVLFERSTPQAWRALAQESVAQGDNLIWALRQVRMDDLDAARVTSPAGLLRKRLADLRSTPAWSKELAARPGAKVKALVNAACPPANAVHERRPMPDAVRRQIEKDRSEWKNQARAEKRPRGR